MRPQAPDVVIASIHRALALQEARRSGGMTLRKMVTETARYERSKPPKVSRFHLASTITVRKFGALAVPDEGYLWVGGEVIGEGGERHIPRIIGLATRFSDEKNAVSRIQVKVKGSRTKSVFASPILAPRTLCLVHCTCQDFAHTFSWHLFHDYGAGLEEPQPYKRVSGSTRPERNPGKYAGVCKHVLALLRHGSSLGFIKET